jgi:hypothetical protein
LATSSSAHTSLAAPSGISPSNFAQDLSQIEIFNYERYRKEIEKLRDELKIKDKDLEIERWKHQLALLVQQNKLSELEKKAFRDEKGHADEVAALKSNLKELAESNIYELEQRDRSIAALKDTEDRLLEEVKTLKAQAVSDNQARDIRYSEYELQLEEAKKRRNRIESELKGKKR